MADGFKLVLKETVVPQRVSPLLFILSPYLTFVLSVLGWVVIPFGFGVIISDIDLSILYILAVSSLGVYGIILAG